MLTTATAEAITVARRTVFTERRRGTRFGFTPYEIIHLVDIRVITWV